MSERATQSDFLMRWLNGDLSEAELASLRNREQYEEMLTSCNTGIALAKEKIPAPASRALLTKSDHVQTTRANTKTLTIFIASTIIALIAAFYVVTSSGWF